MRYAALVAAAALAGCDPLSLLVLDAVLSPKETEHFVLINQPNYFYRSADHHDFKAAESYAWRNCGPTALVDLEVKPSCPNDVTVNLYDAEETLVFSDTFHAPHCLVDQKKDWPPEATAEGVPGIWRIDLIFDISGVKDLQILITGTGDCESEVYVQHGNNGVGNGQDPQPPGQPPINDGPGTGPGIPGNQGGPYVLWRHMQTRDRDVTETYFVRMNGTATAVDADWTQWDAGTLHVTVKDAAGLIVYDHTFDAAHPHPWTEPTASGEAGVWSVTFEALDLTTMGLHVTVYAP